MEVGSREVGKLGSAGCYTCLARRTCAIAKHIGFVRVRPRRTGAENSLSDGDFHVKRLLAERRRSWSAGSLDFARGPGSVGERIVVAEGASRRLGRVQCDPLWRDWPTTSHCLSLD